MTLVTAVAPGTGAARGEECTTPKPFVVALDSEAGTELWRKRDSDAGLWEVMGESDGAVYVHEMPGEAGSGGSSDVVARDIRSGRVRWRQPVKDVGAPLETSVAVPFSVAGEALVLTDLFFLRGLDPGTGHVIWEETLDGFLPVAGTDELVLLRARFDRPSELRAIDRETGEIKWSYPSADDDHLAQAKVTVVQPGTAILELQGTAGRQVALDLGSGRELWDVPTHQVGLNVEDDWRLLFASFVDGAPGPLHAYRPRTREERWIAPLTVNEVTEVVEGLVVTTVYGPPNRFVALDAANGDIEWERDATDVGSIVTSGHGLLLGVGAPSRGVEKRDAVALDAKTGEIEWRHATPEGGGRQWLVGDNVYVSGGCFAADA